LVAGVGHHHERDVAEGNVAEYYVGHALLLDELIFELLRYWLVLEAQFVLGLRDVALVSVDVVGGIELERIHVERVLNDFLVC